MRKLILAALLCTAATYPDRGRQAVVDAANVIPTAQETALNDKLITYEKTSHHQVVVATVPSLGGADIKDYGYKLGRAWGLGDAKRNDGLILLLAPKERKVRIEVGYGLEGTVTDAAASQIIANDIVPKLKANDIGGALTDGADAIIATIEPDQTVTVVDEPAPRRAPGDGLAFALALLGLGGGVASAVALLVRRSRRREREVAMRARHLENNRRALAEMSPSHPPINSQSISSQAKRQERKDIAASQRASGITPSITTPVFIPSTYTAPSYSSSTDSSSSWGSSSSSDSGGYDSGGGSFGGGGSDSSY